MPIYAWRSRVAGYGKDGVCYPVGSLITSRGLVIVCDTLDGALDCNLPFDLCELETLPDKHIWVEDWWRNHCEHFRLTAAGEAAAAGLQQGPQQEVN